MSNKKQILLIILGVLIPIAIVGFLNGIDIAKCVGQGNTYETCVSIFNP